METLLQDIPGVVVHLDDVLISARPNLIIGPGVIVAEGSWLIAETGEVPVLPKLGGIPRT